MAGSKAKPSHTGIGRRLLSARMLVALAMGFSSGLPLMLTLALLQAWLSSSGVDLATVGIFSLVGLPYTLKFLWAPLFDRYAPAFLGRRRGCLLLTQLATISAILLLAATRPGSDPWLTGLAALLLAFCSASQDIVIDAYRREVLADEEQALGVALYTNGYRFGMLVASGGGLVLADLIPFPAVYTVIAGLMSIGVVTTLLAAEPVRPGDVPATLQGTVQLALSNLFRHVDAVKILAFIVLYKLGDNMALHMSIPFFLDLGFNYTEVGTIAQLAGFWATLAGTLVGGLVCLRYGLYRPLLLFGILQAVSTAGYALLAIVGQSVTWLAAVITVENLTTGMGLAALLAFMARLTDTRITATQYALLTSLGGVPRVIASSPTGVMAGYLGWEVFFLVCALLAIPGLVLLCSFRSWINLPDLTAGRN